MAEEISGVIQLDTFASQAASLLDVDNQYPVYYFEMSSLGNVF